MPAIFSVKKLTPNPGIKFNRVINSTLCWIGKVISRVELLKTVLAAFQYFIEFCFATDLLSQDPAVIEEKERW